MRHYGTAITPGHYNTSDILHVVLKGCPISVESWNKFPQLVLRARPHHEILADSSQPLLSDYILLKSVWRNCKAQLKTERSEAGLLETSALQKKLQRAHHIVSNTVIPLIPQSLKKRVVTVVLYTLLQISLYLERDFESGFWWIGCILTKSFNAEILVWQWVISKFIPSPY